MTVVNAFYFMLGTSFGALIIMAAVVLAHDRKGK